MTVYVQDPDLTLHHGDVRTVLPTLPDESVDCVATSPPFYCLRDYNVEGQIGLESTPQEWVDELVAVFRECRRILKPAGTMWVECGDTYMSGEVGRHDNGRLAGAPWKEGMAGHQKPPAERRYKRPGYLKPKDLLGAPWLLAFALRADGWWLRQCIVWHKPNAMPESVTDRCTTAHSYVLLLSKSARYWFDADAIAEPAAWEQWGDQTVPKYHGTDTAAGWIGPRTKTELTRMARAGNGSKNSRSVWTIPTRGFPGAHFATWPEELVRRVILAGCPEQVCGTCGKPRERIVRPEYDFYRQPRDDRKWTSPTTARGGGKGHATRTNITEGWSNCGHGNYRPGVILDPFAGSGTTGLVARRHGRHSILIELNESYCAMAAERLQQLSLLA